MKPLQFWRWFFCGSENSRPGLVNTFFDYRAVICLLIAIALTCLSKNNQVHEIAKSILFPLVGIFIGVSFTGASFALSKVNSEGVSELISRSKKSLEDYVFGIQVAALVLLASVCFGALGATKFFSCAPSEYEYIFRFSLFFLFAMSVVQCWAVIGFSVSLAHLQLLYNRAKRTNKLLPTHKHKKKKLL